MLVPSRSIPCQGRVVPEQDADRSHIEHRHDDQVSGSDPDGGDIAVAQEPDQENERRDRLHLHCDSIEQGERSVGEHRPPQPLLRVIRRQGRSPSGRAMWRAGRTMWRAGRAIGRDAAIASCGKEAHPTGLVPPRGTVARWSIQEDGSCPGILVPSRSVENPPKMAEGGLGHAPDATTAGGHRGAA